MGKNKSKKSKSNYMAYLAKKKRRVELKQPNTGRTKEKMIAKQTKPEFLKSIKVTPNNSIPEQPIVEEKHEESEFVRKVRELTKGYTRLLDDIMIMYSEAKGTDKMSLEEFTKYEMLQREFANALKETINDPKSAYSNILSKYPKNSDEAIILRGLIDEISKTQER